MRGVKKKKGPLKGQERVGMFQLGGKKGQTAIGGTGWELKTTKRGRRKALLKQKNGTNGGGKGDRSGGQQTS